MSLRDVLHENACPRCAGSGRASSGTPCAACGGSGHVRQEPARVSRHADGAPLEVTLEQQPEEARARRSDAGGRVSRRG